MAFAGVVTVTIVLLSPIFMLSEILTLYVHIVLKSLTLARDIRDEKEIKGRQIGKEVKLSLFVDNIILYTENSEEFIKQLLELITSRLTG